MSTFDITELAGNRVLVIGKDHADVQHQAILDGTEWNQAKVHDRQQSAAEDFDAAVEAFYAPIVAAIDRLETASQVEEDPAFFIVTQEAQPGAPAQDERRHYLSHDTVVLRLIEQGNTNRLIWVGDTIEITKAPAVVNELRLEDVETEHGESPAAFLRADEGDVQYGEVAVSYSVDQADPHED